MIIQSLATNRRRRMLVALPASLCFGILLTAQHPASATPPSGYTLAWSDEFNGAVGSSPNSANWGFNTGAGGWGNNELETYVTDTAHAEIISDSAATDGRVLKITATKSGSNYESARILTQGKYDFEYGYVEARAKNPTGEGVWPAFWTMGENGSWPSCGEMDIMELFAGNDGTNMGSFHMGSSPSSEISWTASYTLAGGSQFSQAYHTFGLLWTSTSVTDYVDNVEYETHPSSTYGWAFDQPNYFLINLAVGGDSGSPSGSTFPQSLYMDYVRVYEPSTSGGGGGSGGSLSGTHSLTPECATGSRLDDSGAGTADGNKIDIWASNGTGAQNWATSTSGVSPSGDYSLSTEGSYCLSTNGTASGSLAVLWACNGSAGEAWNIVADSSPSGYYELHPSNATGLCLDVASAGTANGTQVDVYTCNQTNAQQWSGL